MPRNRHPRTIEELERDTWLYGPATPDEERRMQVELTEGQLASAAEHIEDSRMLLAQIEAKLSGAGKPDQPSHA